jgi:threonine/homoserine/homoserine lactone efflux protein
MHFSTSHLVGDGLRDLGNRLYVGFRHMFGQSTVFRGLPPLAGRKKIVDRRALYVEALLLAATNPKPILFFTALFPQFIDTHAALIPQFLTLTGIFMVLSFTTLVGYSIVAARAAGLFERPGFAAWVDRSVGALFMSFGVALLTIRRRAT